MPLLNLTNREELVMRLRWMVILLMSFVVIDSAYADDTPQRPMLEAPPVVAPAAPVEPAWEAWDGSTLGVQLIALPLATGIGYLNGNLGFFLGFTYPYNDEGEDDFWLRFIGGGLMGAGSAIFGYTLSQGLLIGALGDAMGGDGGMLVPAAAGFLNVMLWGGVLYLVDDTSVNERVLVSGFMATTLLTQLAAYHISASLLDDGFSLFRDSPTLSFGIAPTDEGASIGLGFQF